MSSELQLSLLLKRQVEDIYDRNNRASLLAWREYREEIRKRVHPKAQEFSGGDSDDFTLSPYKNYLSKYKENLSQQKYLRELKSEVYSPRALSKERSVSASELKRSKSLNNTIEKVFPMKTLIRLESVISRSNLNKASREYCSQLHELAETILRKLRE